MPSMHGLLQNLRYTNSNVTERTVETSPASRKQSSAHVEGENRAELVIDVDARSEREMQQRRTSAAVDRRKVCRRILRYRVLVEFRSFGCRRRRHLREDDMLMHVSIKI